MKLLFIALEDYYVNLDLSGLEGRTWRDNFLLGNVDMSKVLSLTLSDTVTAVHNATTNTSSPFRYFTGLTQITLPESLTYIGNYAFSDCHNLILITCLVQTPPTAGYSALPHTSRFIKVPVSSVAVYKTAASWSDYASRISAIGEPYILIAGDGWTDETLTAKVIEGDDATVEWTVPAGSAISTKNTFTLTPDVPALADCSPPCKQAAIV